MKEKTIVERLFMILGVIFGFVIWLGRLLFSSIRSLWKAIGGNIMPEPGVDSPRIGERAKQAVSDVTQRAEGLLQTDGRTQESDTEPAAVEPDIESGEDTVVQGFSDRPEDLSHRQHGSLGGVPLVEESPEGEDAGSTEEGISPASAFSYSGTPYDADISEEGVVLNYTDETDRDEDVPLDEGIPNLGEPGDVADVGPETQAEEDVVETVESGVPEEYGQDEEIDSTPSDEPWVADAPGEEEIPAASRGFREYGESSGDDEEIVDTADTDAFGLDDDVDGSGAGGEVDLENDEAPSWDDSDLTIVDDPNEPLSFDAAGSFSEEPSLGLRDSESQGIDDVAGTGENLGLTGDYEEAKATERMIASQGTPGAGAEQGRDQREMFTTGDKDRGAQDSSGTDRADSGDYGRTGEFGEPAGETDAGNVATGESDVNVSPTGATSDVTSDEPDADADGEGTPDTSEAPEKDHHLGVSGDFDRADDTQHVPAVPTEEDSSDEEDTSRESFVTGDDDTPRDQDPDAKAGYSAAWSTPAGVLGEWPNQAEGATGFQSEHSDEESASGEGDSGAEERAPSGDGADAGTSAGQSGEITSEASTRAFGETTAAEERRSDLSGGDPADMAWAAAGDLGTATSPAHADTGQAEIPDMGGDNDTHAGTERQGGEPASRKSRKQRRQQSDWVPQGAVKGDGNPVCPAEYPIKGNANSRIYHRPSDPSYEPTIPEFCFATEEDARKAGFRAPRGH